MKTKQRRNGGKPHYGQNIVRAWFDTVIQFLLRGLETERGFLSQHNCTFRFSTQRLEYVGPVDEHLPAAARPNLEQFVEFFPKVGETISRHDTCEHHLEQSCRVYFSAILEFGEFKKLFAEVKAEAPQVLGGEFDRHFGAYSREEDFMGLLAEHAINSLGDLPSYYSTAALWNHYRDRFLNVIEQPSLRTFREAREEALRAMIDSVDGLTSVLKGTRSQLSLELDVPFVAELSDVR